MDWLYLDREAVGPRAVCGGLHGAQDMQNAVQTDEYNNKLADGCNSLEESISNHCAALSSRHCVSVCVCVCVSVCALGGVYKL